MQPILILNYASYLEPLGGGSKADRYIAESIAASGRPCKVVVPASHCEFDAKHAGKNSYSVETQVLNGVSLDIVFESRQSHYRRSTGLLDHAIKQIKALRPQSILICGSDRGYQLLKIAVTHSNECNVIHIPRTTLDLPFGPNALVQDTHAANCLQASDTILCPSQYLVDYIAKWGNGLRAEKFDVPVYGQPPLRNFGDNPGEYITLVNPSQIKGISIFLELAKLHPDWNFAAVPTWATSSEDLLSMSRQANIRILKPSRCIAEIFKQTKVLLVPSLWDESFGMIVVEAMLHGIPVLASNVGGLPEAKLGTDFLLPVNPISNFSTLDPVTRAPHADVGLQPIHAWSEPLLLLMGDADAYRSLSKKSRRAAEAYVRSLNLALLESILSRKRTTHPSREPKDLRPFAHHEISPEDRQGIISAFRKRYARKESQSA